MWEAGQEVAVVGRGWHVARLAKIGLRRSFQE